MFDFDKPNPYNADTDIVKWQLWENAKHQSSLAKSFAIDAEKAQEQWKRFRVKSDAAAVAVCKFEDALGLLEK